ncbi:histidine kinase [Kribbella sp. NBC_01245]|uniref:histidine kinase n=1 Tax=Kribbella sp. NBC_01245 TaxID=2903578 RepID=UPI002E2BAEAA|nr:histidine kinase [Kribbella sp. NBC_01245]
MRQTHTEAGWIVRVLTTVVAVASLALSGPEWSWPWAITGISLACFLAAMAVLTRHPRFALAGLAASGLIAAVVVGLQVSGVMVLTALSIVMFAIHYPRRIWPIVAFSTLCAAVLTASAALWDEPGRWLLGLYGLIVILVLLGLNRRQFEAQTRQTVELLVQTRMAQQEQARAAALDERGRIARELHDVLAHALGALTVQLDVAEALLTERNDPEAALERVRRSRRLAVQGLVEARNAVAALRADVPALPDALAALVAQHRVNHAVPIELHQSGTPRPVSSGVAVALLGASREALTNAAKHASGAQVDVRLDYLDDRTSVTIEDSGPAQQAETATAVPGFGLTGMRERLALVGGTLAAGQARSGWRVVAEVPVRMNGDD